MTQIDQFESAFKSASKTLYEHATVPFASVLVATDRPQAEAEEYAERVRHFLAILGEEINWQTVIAEEYSNAEELLSIVQKAAPDLVVTYRNLRTTSWKFPHSLGSCVNVLTQVGGAPVLLLPHPLAGRELDHALKNTDRVMCVAGHLTGDHQLVNHGARFTVEGGTLYLAHVEDDTVFERYMETISKIPEIDTDLARETISLRLLKEPRDYIESCRSVLQEVGLDLIVEDVVTVGHRVSFYRDFVEQYELDLLVLHTKDEDQLAMHGLAYPLAVELREIPLLLL